MKNQNKQHFSHHHILIPLQLNQGEKIDCKACEKLIFEPFHGCLSCNFYLHDSCADAPRSLDHPSHPDHPLTLLPTPMYPSGSFTCDACGARGNACSFSCARCEFDIHVQCAGMPNTIRLENHPHEVKMIFSSPYEDKRTIFSCSVCNRVMNPDQWLYYCGGCDFGAHLGCCAASMGKDSRKETQDEEENAKPKVSGKEGSSGDGGVGSRDSSHEKEKAIFEAQRKLQLQNILNKLMLQALDNAADYVGPSYTREYYYY